MSDRTGQHLGNYHLLHLLGKGGFAEVYLGEHTHLATQAAIKVLLAHLGSKNDVEDFRREAQTIARLIHPHIVRVLDFDVEQGVPFLVMEYAPSGSLRTQHPRGQPLPLPLVLSYVQQVASALQYAHKHRLIHRDIKPDNMLLRDEQTVILSDFGIVTIAHSTSSRGLEALAGTPAYMAPEQMQGNPRPASDQYALAISVYEWITGQLPFRGTAMEVAMQHALKPPPPLLEQAPTLPRAVEQVLLTALAKDPKERFATIQAFAIALEQAVDGEQDVSTFIKPSNLPKASTFRESTPSAARPSPSEPGIVATPPTKSPSDRREQATTPPLEIRPSSAALFASPRISSQRSSGKHIRQPTASPDGSMSRNQIPPLEESVLGPQSALQTKTPPLPVGGQKRPPKRRKALKNLLFVFIGFLALPLLLLIINVLVPFYGWASVNIFHRPSADIFQMNAVVGHNDSEAQPSVFFALDVQGQIGIIEMPGGNPSRAIDYVEPHNLSGSNISVTLRFQDMTGDSLPDMMVYADQIIQVFVNTGTLFRPAQSGEVQQDGLPGPASSNANYPVSWTNAVVGHNDNAAHPSDFLATNIRRQTVVVEFPGGSLSKAVVYTGPYLVGTGEDQLSVTLSFSDRNHDGRVDMIWYVADHQASVFYNNGTSFASNASR